MKGENLHPSSKRKGETYGERSAEKEERFGRKEGGGALRCLARECSLKGDSHLGREGVLSIPRKERANRGRIC